MRFVGWARFYWRICSSFGGSDEEYNYSEAAVMTERKSSRASKMFCSFSTWPKSLSWKIPCVLSLTLT